MIPFATNEIHDEDGALDWWEQKFAASCESMGTGLPRRAQPRGSTSWAGQSGRVLIGRPGGGLIPAGTVT